MDKDKFSTKYGKLQAKAREEAEAEAKILASSYAEVFGEDGRRNVHQQRVWADLERLGFVRIPVSAKCRDGAGRGDPLALAVSAGKQEAVFHIRSMVDAGTT